MERSIFWKILLVAALVLSLVAFVLGWIGFGVPDWHQFRLYDGAILEFYGLWSYCQEQVSTYGTLCNRWTTAEDLIFGGTRPTFIYTADALITIGMILLSLGFIFVLVATILPVLSFVAAGLALLSFIFLVIGLPIFGRESNNLSVARGDSFYGKRYGFWLIVPTIILEFLAALLLVAAGIFYKRFGFGNITTGSSKDPHGGKRLLGPPNMIVGPNVNVPYGSTSTQLFGRAGMAPISPSASPLSTRIMPSLLSQYLTQQVPRFVEVTGVRYVRESALPQPSITRAILSEPVSNVAPVYLRAGEPGGPGFAPIINLSGETIIGPIVRTR